MAVNRFITLLAFTLLFTLTVSSDPAATTSPAPSPQLGSDDSVPVPPPRDAPSSNGSPPSPPPASDLSPTPSPTPTPSADKLVHTPSPAPETAAAADVSSVKNEEKGTSKSGGMSGGKKAGIAIGVIAAACVIGFGGLLYKKRQQNIRRAEFSSAARREFL